MTSHYVDIRLRPEPELAPHHLMSAVYGRLHRALVQLGCDGVGVSLPDHDDAKPSPGARLRLHGQEITLRALMDTGWLHAMRDHLQITEVRMAPPEARCRVVSRVQSQSNPDRLRRRAMKRHGLDVAEAARRIPDSATERLRLPFITLGSLSTGQPSFPLFIRHGELMEVPVAGSFSTYGLSRSSTIPWF